MATLQFLALLWYVGAGWITGRNVRETTMPAER
jgi:hypothetical protein